nr:hypothetical protein Iba_chr15dCG4130 [Ipomoea batatas]
MLSFQPSLISFSISADVIPMAKQEIQNCFLDNFKAPFLSHTLGTVIGVAPSTIPVTLYRLWMRSSERTTPACSVILYKSIKDVQ